MLDREQGEVAAVQHQRRRLDQREQRADVDLEQGPQETWTVLGLAIDRCILATQRRNRSSPARLGMAAVTGSAVPQVSSTRLIMASARSGGIPIG